MAMVRNESIARVIMLLCFSTALLSLSVHWHVSSSKTSTPQVSQPRKAPNQTPATNQPSFVEKIARFLPFNQANTPGNDLARAQLPQNSSTLPKSAIAKESRVVVDLSNRRVYVYRMGEVIASYPTGIGKKGWETPTGTFQVMHMQHDPVWRHPITGKVFSAGEDSPLGDRWIGFMSDKEGEIGFHGTPDETLVGAPVSHGCLRMRNADVRMLYNQVKIGTTVEVRH